MHNVQSTNTVSVYIRPHTYCIKGWYFDTVHLSLKPHKCDQCDKSIEAVGNEHSFQYYSNIKNISVNLATSMHCHSLCETDFHDKLQNQNS